MPQRGPLIFLAVVLAALVPLLVEMAWPFVTPFILSTILAIVIHPANNWIICRIHRPPLATFLTTFAAVLLLGLILVSVGFGLTRELAAAYDALSRRSLEEGGWLALVTHATEWALDAAATLLPVNKEAIRAEILIRMKTVTGYLLKNVGAAVGGVTSIVITGLLVTIFVYFMLRYGEGWVCRLAGLIPLDPLATARLFQTVKDSVVANVNGVLAVAVGQGVLLGLGFWFVGLRAPLLWGAVGGLASIVPIVGSPLIWVPVVIAFIVMGAYWKAVILGLWGAVVVGSIDNVLRPFVVGARGKQHPVVIALAVIGGTYAFGILGILLGPLIVSLAGALLQELHRLVSVSVVAEARPRDAGAQPSSSTVGE